MNRLSGHQGQGRAQIDHQHVQVATLQGAADGVDLAQAAGEALAEIGRHIVQITERNLSISAATEEQAQVAREVDRNLTSIRDLSTQNAAGAEQTAAASNDLARLAGDLNGAVRQFHL